MSTAIALPASSTADTVNLQLARLRELRLQVHTADVAEACSLVENSRRLREWVRITKAARELRIEALLLEVEALRQLGLVGGRDLAVDALVGLTTARVSWAKSFAAVAPTLWDNYLARVDKDWTSPTSLAHLIDGTTQQRERARREYVTREAAEDPRRAAMTLLQHYEGRSFNVSDTVTQLIDDLGMYQDDEVIRAGMTAVVHEALRHGVEEVSGRYQDIDGNRVDIPVYVTRVADGCFERVRFGAAVLDDLRSMAEYREQQARDLTEAADALRRAVTVLEAVDPEDAAWLTDAVTKAVEVGLLRPIDLAAGQ